MPAKNKPYCSIKVNILNFQKKIQISRLISFNIKRAARETIYLRKRATNALINICLCTDRKIRVFNRKYFFQDCPTDVIAFNTQEPGPKGGLLADIIISTDTVISNSIVFKTAPLYELCFCAAHGVLHALGYEDDTEKKRRIMHKKQEQICRYIKQKR